MKPFDVEAVRERFPIFQKQIYINSCSQGALSIDVRQAYDHNTCAIGPNDAFSGGAEREHGAGRRRPGLRLANRAHRLGRYGPEFTQ